MTSEPSIKIDEIGERPEADFYWFKPLDVEDPPECPDIYRTIDDVMSMLTRLYGYVYEDEEIGPLVVDWEFGWMRRPGSDTLPEGRIRCGFFEEIPGEEQERP